jgi:hypothetical protein
MERDAARRRKALRLQLTFLTNQVERVRGVIDSCGSEEIRQQAWTDLRNALERIEEVSKEIESLR